MAGDAGDLKATLSLENKQFLDAMKEAQKGVEDNTAQIASDIEGMGDAIGKVTLAWGELKALGGLADFAADLLDVANKSDKLAAVFQNLNGHTEETKQLFEDLSSLEFKSMYDFEDTLGPAAVNMMKLGVSADQTKETIGALVDQAAGLKEAPEWITQVSNTLGTMQTHIVASGKDMKALTAEGIDAWGALADEMGVSIKQAMDEVKKGTVSAQEVIGAVTEDIKSKWGGAAQESMDSWKGAIHILDEATEDLQKELGETIKQVLTDLKPIIDDIVAGLKAAAEWWANLGEPVKEAVVVFTAAVGALTAIGVAMTALEAIGAAAAFNPVTLAVAALVAGLAVLAKWIYDEWPAIVAVFEEGVNYLKGAFSPLLAVWSAEWDAIKQVVTFVWDQIKGFFGDVMDGISLFIGGIAKLAGSVPGLGDEVKKLGSIWDEQQQKMKDAAASADANKKAQQDARDAAIQTAAANKQAAEAEAVREKQAAAAAEAAKKAAAEEKARAAEVAKNVKEWQTAYEKLQRADDALAKSNKKNADDFTKVNNEMKNKAVEMVDIIVSNYDRLGGKDSPLSKAISLHHDAEEAMGKLGLTSTEKYTQMVSDAESYKEAVKRAFEGGQASAADLVAAEDAVKKKQQELVDYTNKDMTDAYHQFGLKTVEEMNNMQTKSSDAYDKIVADAGADSIAAKEAWVKKTEEAYANILQQGGQLTQDQKKELDQRKQDIQDHLDTTKSQWKDAYDTIKGSVSGAFDEIIGKLVTGDTSFGETFKKLFQDLESTVLHTFLDPVKEAFSKFVAKELADVITGSGNLLDNFKQLGSSIGGIFGKSGSAAGGGLEQIGSGIGGDLGGGGGAAGGVGGAASAVGGGLMSTLGSIGAIGSFVTGAIGNIQNISMSTDLGHIEENTRICAILLRDQIWTWNWPILHLETMTSFLVTDIDEITIIMRGVGENIAAIAPDVRTIVGFGPYLTDIRGILNDVRTHTGNLDQVMSDPAARAINVSVSATGVTADTAKVLGDQIASDLSKQLVGSALRG